jgi:hypothetical protein
MIAKRILRRIALRGGSSTLSEASRNKYGIRTDAAGEYYSTLLQEEPRPRQPRQQPRSDDDLQADESRVIPEEDERMPGVASQESEVEVRDEEHEAFLASRPKNEWQEFALAEWENRPSITARESRIVMFGDATVAEVAEHHALLNRWRHYILVAQANIGR